MVLKIITLSAAVFGIIWAQNDSLEGPITIAPEIHDKISHKSWLDIKNQIINQVTKKCDTKGGSTAVTIAQNGFTNLTNCIQSLFSMMQLTEEIEQANSNGKINEVFSKYCMKKSEFVKCFYDMIDVAETCYTNDEIDNFASVKNVTKQLFEHICYNNGVRILVFIAEGSQNCFMEQESGIKKCFRTTKGQNSMTTDSFTYLMDPISFNKTSCEKTTVLRRCINDALGNCKERTTANEVDTLFEIVRNSTPCHTFADKSNDSTSIHLTSAITTLIAMATSIMFFLISYY